MNRDAFVGLWTWPDVGGKAFPEGDEGEAPRRPPHARVQPPRREPPERAKKAAMTGAREAEGVPLKVRRRPLLGGVAGNAPSNTTGRAWVIGSERRPTRGWLAGRGVDLVYL